VIGRLNILANDINEETKTLSADMRPAILRNRDAEVRTQVAGLRDLAQNLAAKIPRYEAKFKDVASRKIEWLGQRAWNPRRRLSRDEAFLIAVNIAKLPSVPRQILKDIPRPPNTASRDDWAPA
jgi:hypothetical protein